MAMAKQISKWIGIVTVAGFLGGCARHAETAVPAAAAITVPAEASAALLAARQGGVVEVPGLNLKDIPDMARVVKPLKSPQFLISDDPEYIRVPEAIAMQEKVDAGTVRLYVYNVNGVKEPQMERRISAVIENLGEKPMEIRMLRSAYVRPTGNYFEAGKSGLEGFLKSSPQSYTRQVPVGGGIPVDQAMEESVANYDELVHGFYEFEIDQPARISVVQTDPKTPSAEVVKRLTEVLPTKSKSGAGRGKFLTNNFKVTLPAGEVLDSANGPCQLIVADGKTDPWIEGTESTTTATAVLKGNYGVVYTMELERTSSDGRGLALIMYNARFGSQWCGGMAAAVTVSGGVHPAGVVRVPSDRLNTVSAPEVSVVQVFPPLPKGKKEKIQITYSPPGASCLPTPLVFVPVDFPAK